jgi:hypothetical protein
MQYILYGFEPLLHPEVEITDFRSRWCVHTPPTDTLHPLHPSWRPTPRHPLILHLRQYHLFLHTPLPHPIDLLHIRQQRIHIRVRIDPDALRTRASNRAVATPVSFADARILSCAARQKWRR